MLTKISPADMASLPISLERAKVRLRIDANDDDVDLDGLLRAGVAAFERETGRVLSPGSYEFTLDCWASCCNCWPGGYIRIPLVPVRGITEVAYLDEAGVEQVVTSTDWYWRRTPEGAELRFISGYSFPTLYDRPGSIIIRFDAGYDDLDASGAGDDPEFLVPPNAELAVLFLVGHWHQTRESVQAAQHYEVPETFNFLTSHLRIFR